jgi:hypothetical protein
MPIDNMRFEDGIFYARQSGSISEAEARQWVDSFRAAAEASPTPIVALVDALEVTYIQPAASVIFIEGSTTPNVKAAAVVTRSTVTNVRARTISMMSENRSTHQTYIFSSMAEAEQFARTCLSETEVSLQPDQSQS